MNFWNANIKDKICYHGLGDDDWCATNADCRLADWQVNEINIVVKWSNRFSIPKL